MHQTKWPQNIKAKTAKILRIKGQMHIVLLFTTMMQILVGRIQQGKDIWGKNWKEEWKTPWLVIVKNCKWNN